MISRNFTKILMSCMISIGLLGCGLKEGVIEKDAQSLLWFTGNTSAATVLIDDQMQISLAAKYAGANGVEEVRQNNSLTYYKISPGKHNIVIKKDGKEVLNRILLLEAGVVKEINVP